MDLETYISEVCAGITNGLNKANQKAGRNKESKQEYQFDIDTRFVESRGGHSNFIGFDLAIGYEKGEQAKAGMVAVIGGFGASLDKTQTYANRVKFRVRVS